MSFTTFTYFSFLFAFFCFYQLVPKRLRNLSLLLASYGFYAAWDARFLALLVGTSLLDFFCGREIGRSEQKKKRQLFLVISLVANLGVLAVFKYFNFFTDTFLQLFVLEESARANLIRFVLPLGISFFTFQSMSYTIDIYRRQLKPHPSVIDFLLYVSFFPQLVAGPIERAGNLLKQFAGERLVGGEKIYRALQYLFAGMLIKLVFADNLAYFADIAFADPGNQSKQGLLLGMYAYAFQIYGDFWGYTLLARGSALLFGIELSLNFDHPYYAQSPREFWRRWHISLSTWFRDYLYIPLGGNKAGLVRNVFITMVIAGLWHGANFTFLAWGAIHAGLLAVQHLIRLPLRQSNFFAGVLMQLVTFHLVCIAWVFFRADSIKVAMVYLERFTLAPWIGAMDAANWSVALLFGGAFVVVDFLMSRREGLLERFWQNRWSAQFLHPLAYGCGFFAQLLFGDNYAKQFIYFIF